MTDSSTGMQHLTAKRSQSGRKAFVTGGTGLVGSHLLQALVRQGYSITALYRKNEPQFLDEKLHWLKGDILDIASLEEGMNGADEVYHCAAVVDFHRRKGAMYKTNIEGSANVVNVALDTGVRKMCYVSSVAALGHPAKGLITEETKRSEADKTSVYGKSKQRAEIEVWRGIAEGLNAVIINPSIVLGSSDWSISSTKIFKVAYDEFPYFSEGATGFVDVKDVVQAMLQLMQSNISGERFIVSAENLEYKDVFTAIAKAFNKKPPSKKINRFVTSFIWRFEALKSRFTNSEPLLTKETADAAHTVKLYDNSKLLRFLPSFRFTPIDETIKRVCNELRATYNL